MDLSVAVRARCVQPCPQNQAIVCGYGGAVLHVAFDAEWEYYPQRHARISYVQDGKPVTLDVPFFGEQCLLPAVHGTDCAEIGFYAGNLRTTVPARVPCLPAITEIPAEEAQPCADPARLLLARLAGKDASPPCNGLYLVTEDLDYLVTKSRDFILAKE